MMGDELAGFIGTPETMMQYYERIIEAEKTLGSLSIEEKIVILKSLTKPITFNELIDTMAGKRILVIKEKDNEKHS